MSKPGSDLAILLLLKQIKQQLDDNEKFQRRVILALDQLLKESGEHTELLKQLLEESQKQTKLLEEILKVLNEILGYVKPRLTSVILAFQLKPSTSRGEKEMPPVAGPLTFTDPDQVAVASLLGFDQDGNPMPDDFVMPAATFTNDDPDAAVIAQDGDSITPVADGEANVSGTVETTDADGNLITLEDTQPVTVDFTIQPPPEPVLTSVKLAFDVTGGAKRPIQGRPGQLPGKPSRPGQPEKPSRPGQPGSGQPGQPKRGQPPSPGKPGQPGPGQPGGTPTPNQILQGGNRY